MSDDGIMYRARFHVHHDDYRPVIWPIKHPYWCTGFGEGYNIVVAYVDNEKQLLEQWPEADEIDLGSPVEEYIFTDRFKKPDWFSSSQSEGTK